MLKTWSFFFHYNKPASQRAGRPMVTVHYRNKCIVAQNIDCRVATAGRIRSSQPRFVMTGKATDVSVIDGVAVIT